jgi:tetratricopeptide (TPR) repeat protein
MWNVLGSPGLLFFLLILFTLQAARVSSDDGGDSDVVYSQYVGCFQDNPEQRALPAGVNIEKGMTVGRCVGLCSKHGFHYAGLQYRTECYCGTAAPKYAELDASRCRYPCGGDPSQTCGGDLALSVHFIPKPSVAVASSGGRPLIALTMILKDEAHTIKHTLDSVKDIVDVWYLPGKLFSEPFVDYGATRNRILELTAEQTPRPVFTLTLSADERVLNPEVLREAMEARRSSFGARHEAYFVQMDSGVLFDSIRLARVDANWRYVGRVHEFLANPKGVVSNVEKPVPHIQVKFRATDSQRRHKSQYRIRDFLEMDYKDDPTNARTIIYLARVNGLLGNYSRSLFFYEQLAQVSRWGEERYHARVMAADMHKKVAPRDYKTRQSLLLDAFQSIPTNIDALYALAQEHFDEGRYELAYLFALHAVAIPEPANRMAVQSQMLRDVGYLYEFEAHRLLGFTAEKLKKWEICVRELAKVLETRTDDKLGKQVLEKCHSRMPAGWALDRDRAGGAGAVPPVVFMEKEKACWWEGTARLGQSMGMGVIIGTTSFLVVLIIGLLALRYHAEKTERLCASVFSCCSRCGERKWLVGWKQKRRQHLV